MYGADVQAFRAHLSLVHTVLRATRILLISAAVENTPNNSINMAYAISITA
jgi:hypothetical protein